MKTKFIYIQGNRLSLFILLLIPATCLAISRPEKQFPVFQFPQDQIPRIDGSFEDWDLVPDSYSIGLDELMDTQRGRGRNLDPADFDISVKVGWVKGLNRLYFYYDAEDDFWNFDSPDLKNDMFELVVDGDLSGGNFIKRFSDNSNLLPFTDLHFKGHGAHAQNYHIFTPVKEKSWAMVWGSTPWIKEFPHALVAYDFNFKHGESGRLRMEFYITPFDHADPRGFFYSAVSNLVENDLIGLSWCVLEYDNDEKTFESFMNLSHDTQMVKNASYLCAFKLMPLESHLRPLLDPEWSFVVHQNDPRTIFFYDNSWGNITKWSWDFGDGSTSNLQNPVHQYESGGEWTVTLTIAGPHGKTSLSKVWDVVTP